MPFTQTVPASIFSATVIPTPPNISVRETERERKRQTSRQAERGRETDSQRQREGGGHTGVDVAAPYASREAVQRVVGPRDHLLDRFKRRKAAKTHTLVYIVIHIFECSCYVITIQLTVYMQYVLLICAPEIYARSSTSI